MSEQMLIILYKFLYIQIYSNNSNIIMNKRIEIIFVTESSVYISKMNLSHEYKNFLILSKINHLDSIKY